MKTIESFAPDLQWALLVVFLWNTLLAVFLWNIAVFTHALRYRFSRPDGVRTEIRWMGAAGLMATMLGAFTLWIGSDPSLVRWTTTMGLLVISRWLFRATLFNPRRMSPPSDSAATSCSIAKHSPHETK